MVRPGSARKMSLFRDLQERLHPPLKDEQESGKLFCSEIPEIQEK